MRVYFARPASISIVVYVVYTPDGGTCDLRALSHGARLRPTRPVARVRAPRAPRGVAAYGGARAAGRRRPPRRATIARYQFIYH